MKTKTHRKTTSIILTIIFLITLCSPSIATSLFDRRSASLFIDKRARMVGDILTIEVVEQTSAVNKGKSKFSKKVDMKGGVSVEGVFDYLLPNFFEPIEPLKALNINPEESFDGSGETSSNNTFSTRITVTVIEVLPNGNLVIEGTRNVKVNEEDQEIVLQGVIRPYDITPQNTIASTLIADAVIFYKGKGPIGNRNKPGFLTRLFQKVF